MRGAVAIVGPGLPVPARDAAATRAGLPSYNRVTYRARPTGPAGLSYAEASVLATRSLTSTGGVCAGRGGGGTPAKENV